MPVVIHVFEPPMCCSTGVCGPVVDPQLARFAADIEWLKRQGVSVERYNLGHQPSAFAQDPVVREALETKGEAGLPLLKVNGVVKSTGVYPSRQELADWSGIATSPSDITDGVSSQSAVMGGCCSPSATGSKKSGCC